MKVPDRYAGRSLKELDLRNTCNLTVLATLVKVSKRNILGIQRNVQEVKEVAHADTILNKEDLMVIYGHEKDIERFLE